MVKKLEYALHQRRYQIANKHKKELNLIRSEYDFIPYCIGYTQFLFLPISLKKA